MAFRNREEAGEMLAARLVQYRGKNPLVLAIPRGALPMGAILADTLNGELDVVLVHKLGAPGNPEYAIGSVDEEGHVQLSNHAAAMYMPQGYIEREVASQLNTLRERRARYTPVRPPISPAGRTVILVDDGIATGATLIAAAKAVREKKPEKIVVAVGVAPCEAIERIRDVADDVVCLECSDYFFAVGQFYRDFSQVSDEEVVRILSGKYERAPVPQD